MTIPQLFHALIYFLTSQPESNHVDQLLADLAAKTALRLHDTTATSLKLACLQISNPEPVIAADQLLRHYGFALTIARHTADAHLISIKRLPDPSTDLYGRVRANASTEGAFAA